MNNAFPIFKQSKSDSEINVKFRQLKNGASKISSFDRVLDTKTDLTQLLTRLNSTLSNSSCLKDPNAIFYSCSFFPSLLSYI